jgi:hypothetical protein
MLNVAWGMPEYNQFGSRREPLERNAVAEQACLIAGRYDWVKDRRPPSRGRVGGHDRTHIELGREYQVRKRPLAGITLLLRDIVDSRPRQ